MSIFVVVVVYDMNRLKPWDIDQALTGSVDDWFRFNGLTWFVQTSKDASQITAIVTKVLTGNESVVVVKADLSDYNGWASEDTWRWLQSKMSLANALAGGSFENYSRRNALTGGPGSGFAPPFVEDDKKK